MYFHVTWCIMVVLLAKGKYCMLAGKISLVYYDNTNHMLNKIRKWLWMAYHVFSITRFCTDGIALMLRVITITSQWPVQWHTLLLKGQEQVRLTICQMNVILTCRRYEKSAAGISAWDDKRVHILWSFSSSNAPNKVLCMLLL